MKDTCIINVNEKGEELIPHGTTQFPIECYEENISETSIDWHWHEDLEIIWVLTGTVRVMIHTTKCILETGQGIFINRGMLHFLDVHSDQTTRICSIVFHPRLIGSVDSIYWQKFVDPLINNKKLPFVSLDPSVLWQKDTLEYASVAWNSMKEKSKGYEIHMRNALSELLLLIWSNYTSCESGNGYASIRSAERMKTMLRFIHLHFNEEISLHDLAEEALISQSEVLRCFRNTVWTTPMQYIKDYRIQRASLLLTNTDLTSSQVALECGFQSSSYFIKTFKEKMGCTPLNYRKQALFHNPL